MVAAKLANMPLGGAAYRSANLQTDQVSQSTAAELLNVSTRTVANAKRVMEDATPELMQAVERGAVSVSAAAENAFKLSKLRVS